MIVGTANTPFFWIINSNLFSFIRVAEYLIVFNFFNLSIYLLFKFSFTNTRQIFNSNRTSQWIFFMLLPVSVLIQHWIVTSQHIALIKKSWDDEVGGGEKTCEKRRTSHDDFEFSKRTYDETRARFFHAGKIFFTHW